MNALGFASRAKLLMLTIAAALLMIARPVEPQDSSRVNNFIEPSGGGFHTELQEVIRASTTLVQIDAIVTDRNGKHIGGLSAENFQIAEDNHLQRVIALDYFDASKGLSDRNAEPIFISLANSNDSGTLRTIGLDHRLIVLFFDLTSFRSSGGGGASDFDNVFRTVGAAKKFVKEKMTAADLVSVVSFGTDLLVLCEFTNDRGTVDQALDSLVPGKGALNPSLPKNMNNTLMPGTFVTGAETSLYVLNSLTEMLAQIPGRKSVIHFTDGLGSSAGGVLERITGAANKNNVSFYEVVAEGLCAGGPQASVGYSGDSVGIGSQTVGCAKLGTLYTLAADTGGKLFTNSNDLMPYFDQVLEDSTAYYLLSYDPTNKLHDGSYRSVSVRLVGVPGGQVKFRSGYYAPSETKQRH
jgi:VWFA-related protein